METTARFGLPLLAVGQAAKEMTVNEALTAIELVVQPVVEAEIAAPPMSPAQGQGWLVAKGASGAFANRDGAVAIWTAGGWRFAAPFEGMSAWKRDDGAVARRRSASWQVEPPVAVPGGGSVIDTEARQAIGELISSLRNFGLIKA